MRQQPIFVIAVRAKSVCRRGGGGCICRRFAGVIMLGPRGEVGYIGWWLLAVGWWVYGLGYEIMLTHLTLQFASCTLFSVAQRVVYAIPGKQCAPITQLHSKTPALPHPPFHRAHSICLLFGKCFYLCLRSFNYFCKLRCAHFLQLSGEI